MTTHLMPRRRRLARTTMLAGILITATVWLVDLFTASNIVQRHWYLSALALAGVALAFAGLFYFTRPQATGSIR